MDSREGDVEPAGVRDRVAAILGEDTVAGGSVDDTGYVDGESYPIAVAAYNAVRSSRWWRHSGREEDERRIAEYHGHRLLNASPAEREAYRRMLQGYDNFVAMGQFMSRNARRQQRAEREVRRQGLNLARREPTEQEVRQHDRAVARREPRHRHRRERGNARASRRGQARRGDGGWGRAPVGDFGWGRAPVRMNANGFMPRFSGDDGSADGWRRRDPVDDISERNG